MHFDFLHSSIYQRHHLPLHPSSFFPCVEIYSNSIVKSTDVTIESIDFSIESSNLFMVLITYLSSLLCGCHGVASSFSFSSITLSSWIPLYGWYVVYGSSQYIGFCTSNFFCASNAVNWYGFNLLIFTTTRLGSKLV